MAQAAEPPRLRWERWSAETAPVLWDYPQMVALLREDT